MCYAKSVTDGHATSNFIFSKATVIKTLNLLRGKPNLKMSDPKGSASANFAQNSKLIEDKGNASGNEYLRYCKFRQISGCHTMLKCSKHKSYNGRVARCEALGIGGNCTSKAHGTKD